MKFKKSMLILILAVFFLSIAGVCASDVDDTQMASQENAAIESTDENMITVEDSEPALTTASNEEMLSDSADEEVVSAENDLDKLRANPGTYSELSTEIGSGGNVKLTHDYYTYDNGTTIVISTDNSVIDGNGAIIDMAGSINMEAFNVTASGVTIKNLTIKNVKVYDNGAAICFKNAGTVENCNFVNNNVSNLFGKGGAIYFYGAGNVINCNFTDNYGGYGGAVYFSTNGDVSGCSFVNNTALISGGAISFNEDGTVKNCNFTNNSAFNGAAIFIENEGIVENCISVNDNASYNGGAIWIANGIVENCIFVNDSAGYFGGAVFLDNEGTIKNCNFTNNSAAEDGGENGGAICIWIDGIVENCNFVDNNAAKYGGGICFYTTGEVINCSFVNNNAAEYGGAIVFYDEGHVTDCIFVNNSARVCGAILFYQNGHLTNCNFTNNTASNSAGAVYFNLESDVTDCIFVNNSAKDGGALRFQENSNVINSIFVNNSAEDSGGAVYFYDAGEVTNCNFTNNHAKYGGAIDFDGDGTVETCIFVDNSAEEGGAVYINENGDVTNCNFTNNTAGTRGGALYFSGYADVTDCNFTNNNAGDYGGAVFVSSYGDGNITNCVFVDNAAFSYYGGGIFCLSNTEVTNCNFTNNNAGQCAGAVCFYNTGELTNCNFINNSAESKAGAVYIAKDGKLSNSNFTNNSAESNGGAVFIKENGIVENCNFIKNSAEDGGALFINGTAGVTNCNFTDNKVNETQGHGGAIYWNGTNGNVSGSSFVNNSAIQGGSIYWNGANGNVSDCSFVNNTVEEGGIIYWTGNDGVVSGCVFVNNSAEDGIIYFHNQDSGKRLTINNNIFLNNYDYIIHFDKRDLSSNVDYNWFGNNATDYDMAPATINVVIDNWLFLNATANPDAISVSESSDILFKLYSYSEEDNEISDYDNSKLPAINLTLTANNGDVNERTAALGDSVEYTYNGGGDASVTAAIENAEYTIVLDIAKADSILSADDLVMAYKDGSKWNVTLTDANGVAISGRVVKIGIKNKIYSTVTDENGVAGLPINLIPDTYAINATFEGDGDYEASFVNATVTVTQAVATLSAVDLEMAYKDGSAWVVTLTDLNGDAIVGVKVAIGICNKTYHIKTDDAGAANLTINLLPGTYDVNASFSSSRYEAQTITATVTVNKLVPTLSAEDLVMNYKDGSAWNVTLKDAAGNIMAGTYVKFTIGNKTYNRKTNADGVASLPIGLAAGNYTITTEFTGTGTLAAVEITNTIVVNPPEYNLVANDINMTYQDGTNYTVQITDGEGNPVAKAGVVIKMTINEKSYNRKTNEEGIASLPIGLRAGTYPITAEYNGKQITNTIVVNKA